MNYLIQFRYCPQKSRKFIKTLPLLFRFLYVINLSFIFFSCECNDIYVRHPFEFQPQILEGGRIASLCKSPFNESYVLAASESGGLFLSKSYGKYWQHLDLPVFNMVDVKFSQVNRNVIIVSCLKDLKVNNGGGIWRSIDGGKSWSKPASSVYSGNSGNPESHGFEISIEPGTPNVFVGTENGVAMSKDDGNTWTYNTLSKPFRTPRKVHSILTPGGGMALLTSDSLIFKTTDGGNSWKETFKAPALYLTKAFCISPYNKSNVFMTSGEYKLYFSSDFGDHWKIIDAPIDDNRAPFIRCSAILNMTYLYYGGGIKLYRKFLPDSERREINFNNNWDIVPVDHADLSDLIFFNDGMPLLLSGDGGVFNTNDSGKSFHYMGVGKNGLNALQINEVTAQKNLDEDKNRDLIYFGTQDNYFWWSEDAGKNWKHWGNEGHSIEVKRYAIGKKGNLMTFADDGFGKVLSSDYGFNNVADWHPPTPRVVDDPVRLLAGDELLYHDLPNSFIQMTDGSTDAVPITNFYKTLDGGSTWDFIESMNFNAGANNPQVGLLNGEEIIYQSMFTRDTTLQGWTGIGLVRLSNIRPVNSGILRRADLGRFGSLGIFSTEFKWYNVFAVNPREANHVIIADIEHSKMKVTWDGGKNWFNDDELTDLVTSNGSYKFYAEFDGSPRIIVNCMSFNPEDPAQIAVGTRENGMFMSWDKGENWYPLINTKEITNPSKIFFYYDKTLLVSTYGRGLWKFEPVKGEKLPAHGENHKGVFIFDLNKDSVTRLEDDFKTLDGNLNSKIILFNDTLLNVNMKSLKSERKETLTLRNVSIWNQDQDLIIKSENVNISLRRLFDQNNTSGQFDNLGIRGFIVNSNNEAEAFILSNETYMLYTSDELKVGEITQPYIELKNSKNIYTHSVTPHRKYLLEGYNFNSSSMHENEVKVYINDSLIYNLNVNGNGRFEAKMDFPAWLMHEKGFHINVVQNEIRSKMLIQILREGDDFEKK